MRDRIVYNKYLRVNKHTIRTRTDAVGNMPKGWALEASYNGEKWLTLHSINNSTDLSIKSASNTYQCNSNGAFSQFRIRMIEKNTGDPLNNISPNYIFHISKIEFFGTIFTTKNPFLTISLNNKNFSLSVLDFLVFILL